MFIIALCLMNHDLFSQESALWGDLKPGKYGVGFRVLERYDSSRRWRAERKERPVQISIWYPGRANTDAPPLTYRDYFLLSACELDSAGLSPEKKAEAVAAYKTLLVSNGIPKDAADAFFSTHMLARRDLEAAGGLFPLVIVAQGNFHSAHHQSVLCEFLASHGYVVATCPSQTRISGPMKSAGEMYANIVEQSEDIAFLRYQVVANFPVDSARIGLVSHSFGARSAFFYVAEHNDVKAFVSLDGGIGNKEGKDFMRGKKDFDPATIRVPILHFYEEVESFMSPDFDLMNSLENSDRFLVKVEQMNHTQFTSFGMAGATIPGFSTRAEETKLKCEALYNITLCFLDAFVRDGKVDSGARVRETMSGLLPGKLLSLSRIGH